MTLGWTLRVSPRAHPEHFRELSGGKLIQSERISPPVMPTAETIVGAYVSPLLCDTHTHGRMGFSVTDSLDTLKELLKATRASGVGRVQLSTVTLPREELVATLSTARNLVEMEESVIGIHLEGPFLSLEKRGAHAKEFIVYGTLDDVKFLVEPFLDIISSITLDPLSVAPGAIEWLVENGVTVAIGHTMATYGETREAFLAGASVLTHAFNAMRPISSREPGPVAAALESGAWIEVICDGHHVDPVNVKLLAEHAGDRLLLVTDSMPAAGLGDGSFFLGGVSVSVTDGIAMTHDGSLAGSTLSLDQAVSRSVTWGVPADIALAAATINPLKAYRQNVPTLSSGEPADFLVWSDEMRVTHMVRGGIVTTSA